MELPADSLSCVGGPHHGKNLPNAGNVAEVIAGGHRVRYERDSCNLCGKPFWFWRWDRLPAKDAYEMIVAEAADLIRSLMRETFEVASDMAKA